MNARCRRSRCNAGGINDEISHLTVEHIGRYPVQVLGIVRVAIDQAKALEAAGGLKDGAVVRVTNQLSEVRRDKRRRDNVGSRREIDDSWFRRSGSLVMLVSIIHCRSIYCLVG